MAEWIRLNIWVSEDDGIDYGALGMSIPQEGKLIPMWVHVAPIATFHTSSEDGTECNIIYSEENTFTAKVTEEELIELIANPTKLIVYLRE